VTQAGVLTQNLGRSELVAQKYGKQFDLSLDLMKEVQFMVRPTRDPLKLPGVTQTLLPSERYERKWKWKGYAQEEKIYMGEPFPVRNIEVAVHLNSGEVIPGTLQSIPLYVQADGEFTAKKHFLKSKQKGVEGQTLEELVYITSIAFLDKGKDFFADVDVTFRNVELTPDVEVRAIGNKSLQPVPVVRHPGKPNTVIVSHTHGEDPLVGIRKGNTLTVAWPAKGDDELFALADKHLQGQRDFYNDKTLLGVRDLPETQEVLTLAVLRRRKPDNSKEAFEVMRYSVWRWKINKERTEMVLASRGTFFRVALDIGADTLKTEWSADLWHFDKNGNQITVGKQQ
jgi:hypothetical protein